MLWFQILNHFKTSSRQRQISTVHHASSKKQKALTIWNESVSSVAACLPATLWWTGSIMSPSPYFLAHSSFLYFRIMLRVMVEPKYVFGCHGNEAGPEFLCYFPFPVRFWSYWRSLSSFKNTREASRFWATFLLSTNNKKKNTLIY